MSPGARMILTSIADFFLAAGSAVTGAMLQQGQLVMPSKVVWLFAGLTGLVTAWSHVKASLAEPTK